MKRVKIKDRYYVVEGLGVYSIISKKLKVGGYWDHFIPLYKLFEDPEVLFLGVGGGTMLRQIYLLGYRKFWGVDIDRKVLSFLEKEIRKRIIIEDGFDYLKRINKKFDLIVVDVYKGVIMPKKFYSNEFLKIAREKIKERGILAYNFALTPLTPFIFMKFKLDKRFDFLIRPGLNSVAIGLKNMKKKEIIEKLKRLDSFYNIII